MQRTVRFINTLLLLFFLVSGACGLLYEVAWIRAAGTVIGNTAHAVGTVVGVYMGGLALGGWLGGRLADRLRGRRLLVAYAVMEAGIAATALAAPWLLAAADPLFHALWGSPVTGAVRVIVVGLVLLVPTTLMGATLPVLARALAASAEAAPRAAGRAYAANAFGGVAGTLAAGLWLIPAHGLTATTFVAAALNLVVAAGAWGLSRTLEAPEPPPGAGASRPARLALVIAAASGFCALAYEIAWTRALVLTFGSTVYAFTVILSVFILGLAAGSGLGALLLRFVRASRPALAVTQGGIAVAALALLPFLYGLPVRLAERPPGPGETHGSLLLYETGLVAAAILLPTLLMGATFPFACRLAGGDEAGVGRSVGAVYSWNTLGSILGSFAATFLLLPMAGLVDTIRIAATLNLAAAGLLARRPPVLALLLAGIAGAWLLPGWDPKVMVSGAFIYGEANAADARRLDKSLRGYLEEDTELLGRFNDAYGIVTLHRDREGTLSMRVNGKTDASTGSADRANMLFVGHLPLLQHPDPKTALVIGLGGGLTLGAAARHPLESLECVEISPAVIRAADHFKEANGRVLDDPRVRLSVGDGRHALRHGRGALDAVISQPSNLWISGMANLFTREFFAEARDRLAPGGVMGQWLHAYWLSREDFGLVVRTFFDVFPHGGLWEIFPGSDYLLIGSATPLSADFGALSRRLSETGALGEYVADGNALLGHLVAPAARLKSDGPVLTDDHCTIEYSAPLSLHRETRPAVLEWLDDLRREPLPDSVFPGHDASAVSRHRARNRRIALAVRREAENRPLAALEALDLRGEPPPRVRELMERLVDLAVGQARLAGETNDSERRLEALSAIPYASSRYAGARAEMGQVLLQLQRIDGAARAYQEALRRDPALFPAAAGVAICLEERGRWEEAAEAWDGAAKLEGRRAEAYLRKAVCLQRAGRIEGAREAARTALELGHEPARVFLERLR